MDLKSIFDTFYGWTNFLYSDNLDSYLFRDSDGYRHIGVVMIIVTFLASAVYYYVIKPTRKQYPKFFLVWLVSAGLNFLYTLYYTMTPLVNNEIDSSQEWSYLDCFLMGFSDVCWTFVFYFIAAIILKWGSINRYIPFKIF